MYVSGNLITNKHIILGSYGKYTTKLKNWKVPRFLRKHSDTPLHEMKKQELANKSIHFLERGDAVTGLQSSNGYQQVPIVIESQDNKSRQSAIKLNLPPLGHDMASFEREIIDIRSYLSQSRSNMSPFARSSSYRSQYGRSNNIEVNISFKIWKLSSKKSHALTLLEMVTHIRRNEVLKRCLCFILECFVLSHGSLILLTTNDTGHWDTSNSIHFWYYRFW